MPLTELNHYFVRANDLERTKRFYCEVLGFEQMPRPDFAFPGYASGLTQRAKLKFVAVVAEERWERYPNLPTFAEAGFPEINKLITWGGIVAGALVSILLRSDRR